MAALPADIARFTTDGVLIVSPVNPAISAAIAANFIDARDGTNQEIEYFFDDVDDAQAMLDELFDYQSRIQPIYLAVETDEGLGLGDAIAIAPAVPCVGLTDAQAGLAATLRVRAYAVDFNTDRYSVELLG